MIKCLSNSKHAHMRERKGDFVHLHLARTAQVHAKISPMELWRWNVYISIIAMRLPIGHEFLWKLVHWGNILRHQSYDHKSTPDSVALPDDIAPTRLRFALRPAQGNHQLRDVRQKDHQDLMQVRPWSLFPAKPLACLLRTKKNREMGLWPWEFCCGRINLGQLTGKPCSHLPKLTKVGLGCLAATMGPVSICIPNVGRLRLRQRCEESVPGMPGEGIQGPPQ